MLNYIHKSNHKGSSDNKWVTWDDFNSLFATGILKQALIMKARLLKDQDSLIDADQNNKPHDGRL